MGEDVTYLEGSPLVNRARDAGSAISGGVNRSRLGVESVANHQGAREQCAAGVGDTMAI